MSIDVEQFTELTIELFRLRQQLEAYGRLQAEEIEELRTKLRNLEERLSGLAEPDSAEESYA